MTSYKDENWFLNNRYILLWVVSFVLMVVYACLFHDTKEVSESTGIGVAIPYVIIFVGTFAMQHFKVFGDKR